MPSRRDLIAELQRVAALPPSSGRHAVAKASALRQLLRLEDEPVLTEPEQRLWARTATRTSGSTPSTGTRIRTRRLPNSNAATRSVNGGAGGWLSTATDAGKPRPARSACAKAQLVRLPVVGANVYRPRAG